MIPSGIYLPKRQIQWWGGKKKKTSTGWGYFRLHTCSPLIAQQRLWASVLARLRAGGKHSDKCRKAPLCFQGCNQAPAAPVWQQTLWDVEWSSGKHLPQLRVHAISRCPWASFTCLPGCRPELEWKKKGQKWQKTMAGIQDLTLFYWC